MEGWEVRYYQVGSTQAPTVLTGVVADGLIEPARFRWFLLKDRRRIEIPMDGMVFELSAARDISMEESAKKKEAQGVAGNVQAIK